MNWPPKWSISRACNRTFFNRAKLPRWPSNPRLPCWSLHLSGSAPETSQGCLVYSTKFVQCIQIHPHPNGKWPIASPLATSSILWCHMALLVHRLSFNAWSVTSLETFWASSWSLTLTIFSYTSLPWSLTWSMSNVMSWPMQSPYHDYILHPPRQNNEDWKTLVWWISFPA